MGLRCALLLGLSLAPAAQAGPCPPAVASQELRLDEPTQRPPQPQPSPHDYRDRLQPTPAGWPVRDHWCVWLEPSQAEPATAAARRDQDWTRATLAGLAPWRALLAITVVDRPEEAQIRLWRRRPPLQRLTDGRNRASNGRAVLQLLLVDRGNGWQAEPRVEVLLSPGRAPLAMQATALHELGHAFGLWGHSDHPGDAMAAVPTAVPVLQLTPRDRATLIWLQKQSERLQPPARPPGSPAAAPAPQPAPRAD